MTIYMIITKHCPVNIPCSSSSTVEVITILAYSSRTNIPSAWKKYMAERDLPCSGKTYS
jgi:hypothetical protein